MRTESLRRASTISTEVEHATAPGTLVRRAGTTGYAAPEQVRGPSLQPAPGLSADLYSLDTTVFHLVTGTDSLLLPDQPEDRPAGPRAGDPAPRGRTRRDAVVSFAPLVTGLTAETPDDRWSLDSSR